MTFGCEALMALTNLVAGQPKRDLYSAVNDTVEIEPEFDGYAVHIKNRSTGKFMVIRIGYGASTKALVRGLLLHLGGTQIR